jgi:peroxiredoxin
MKYILLVIVMEIFIGCYSKESVKTGREGMPMPSFKLLLADGVTHLDTKDIPTGKPILFFYFGPSCPYSRSQISEIIKNLDLLKDIQLYVFTNSPINQFKQFYNDYHLNRYPSITAGIDFNNSFAGYFQAFIVPYLAIYQKDKTLKKVFIGKTPSNLLIKEIKY